MGPAPRPRGQDTTISTETTAARRTAVTAQVAETRRALLRLRDRQRMVEEACRLAIELGGFRMAWIGWVEGDTIRPLASAGDDQGYTAGVAATVEDEGGRGPTGTAVREHRPAISQDIATDPAMERWREQALERGYRSSAGFPLADGERVVGVLSVYAGETDVFDEHIIADLAELADDVAAAMLHHEEHERRLAAERRYRQLFEQVSEGIFQTGVDGRILGANPAMARTLGYDSVAHLMAEVSNARELYVDPDARDGMLAALREGGEIHGYEVQQRRRDGSPVWLSITARTLRDEEGEAAGLEGLAVDITERKRSEAAIERRDAILTAVSDLVELLLAEGAQWSEVIQDGLARVGAAAGADRAAVIEIVENGEGRPSVNRPYAWSAPGVDSLAEHPRVQGLAYEDAGYAPWAEALAAGETLSIRTEDLDDPQRDLLDDLGTKALLFAPIHVDGQWWGAVNLERVRTDETWAATETEALMTAGRALGAAIARDRTNRAVAAAATVRNRLAAIVESSSDAILAKDLDGTITDWNAGAESLYGWSRAEMVGRHIDTIVPEALHDQLHEAMDRVSRGETVHLVEVERLAKEGGPLFLSLTLSPLRDADGSVVGVSTIGKDVTAVISARRELEDYAHELARSNQELEQFAYVASHDLQEPLRMVTSFVQLLARKYDEQLDDQAQEYIAYAVDGATRMQQLINDLLGYSRVGTQGGPLEPTDLSIVAATALRDLRTTIDEVGATVDLGELPVVLGDATQLRQVLGNLIGNAVKFRGDDAPRIELCADREGEDWVISVADDGIGIAPEHADRIFTLFQRLHTREEYEGTGMGLAISRKIVERHGGRIWVEPNDPRGSIFRFTLPVAGGPG